MKKLLSLLGVIMVSSTATLSVVACNKPSGSHIDPNIDVNENVKTWTQQSSNIAKAIILGKTENLNTNSILENSLNNNINNINKNSSHATGNNYQEFVKTWGYKNNIDNISDRDFNDNNANTIDNNAIITKNKVSQAISLITTILPTIKDMGKNIFANNQSFSKAILSQDDKKNAVAKMLWPLIKNQVKSLKDLPSYLTIIQQSFSQMIEPLFTGLTAFDAKKVIGEQYYMGDKPEDIKGALYDKNGGWLANFRDINNEKIDSVIKKSDILYGDDRITFSNWNQFALFKMGADLNSATKNISQISFSDIFQNSITTDTTGKVSGFSQEQFAKQIMQVYNALIKSTSGPFGFIGIINLLKVLIPIVKYQIGFAPTQNFKIVSNHAVTDYTKGIININDIMDKISNILFNKENFSKFFTDLFFPVAQNKFTDNNFLTFDMTYQINNEKSYAISQIIIPIESQVTSGINNVYDLYLEPFFKNNNVQDIFNKVKDQIIQPDKKFDFNISYIRTVADILNSKSLLKMTQELAKVTDEESLQDNWVNIWQAAGMQEAAQQDFQQNSVLALLQPLVTSDEFWNNIINLFDRVGSSVVSGFDTFINDIEMQHVDFYNKSLWKVNENSISFNYDSEHNESTLNYDLTYQNKTYKIVVVIATNVHDKISNTKKVWLKSLKGLI